MISIVRLTNILSSSLLVFQFKQFWDSLGPLIPCTAGQLGTGVYSQVLMTRNGISASDSTILNSRYVRFQLRDEPGECTIVVLRLPLTVKVPTNIRVHCTGGLWYSNDSLMRGGGTLGQSRTVHLLWDPQMWRFAQRFQAISHQVLHPLHLTLNRWK